MTPQIIQKKYMYTHNKSIRNAEIYKKDRKWNEGYIIIKVYNEKLNQIHVNNGKLYNKPFTFKWLYQQKYT